MASITIRQLDDKLKQRLRLRAARNGRSMEDEVRTILRQAAALESEAARHRRPRQPAVQPSGRSRVPIPAAGTRRVLLIIGGGIAAYKSLDLIRRLQERGLRVRCILTRPRRNSSRRCRPARSRASAPSPICSIPRPSSTSAISAWRARPTSSWSRPRPPT